MLLIDGDIVAKSFVDDDEEPTNVALFYEVLLLAESTIEVKAGSDGDPFRVEPQELQWGYKLYGEGYNLIDELNDDCIA